MIGRVAAPRPPPNQNGTASNEIGDGDGDVNNEKGTYIIQKTYPINTLVAPFNPEAVLPRLDYSMTRQNYIKFPIMEPKPNNSSTAYDKEVKLSFIPKKLERKSILIKTVHRYFPY
ncbi:hypothetical protein GLOIN_2v1483579 [Rhizophagus irregularis DAOM 181602=DAOM 197198]|nr:hypothetical protein GLOIN_2v1483579 [Rhizophagus irregularis DAOM 181602=DAOM 197198]